MALRQTLAILCTYPAETATAAENWSLLLLQFLAQFLHWFRTVWHCCLLYVLFICMNSIVYLCFILNVYFLGVSKMLLKTFTSLLLFCFVLSPSRRHQHNPSLSDLLDTYVENQGTSALVYKQTTFTCQ